MKAKIWKPISLVTIFLLIVCLVGGNIANAYEAMLNQALGIETSRVIGEAQSVYYASDYADLQEMYRAKVQLLRDIADEGTVLLKNDGVLPAEGGKVTIFGEESFVLSTMNGGGAMPETLRALSTTLSEALSSVGYTAGTATDCDIALVVIGRAAGEGADVPFGSLALSDADKANIEAAKKSGGKIVVLLSGDHPIEAAELKADGGVSAILHLGNAGYRGAYGIADVMSGRVNPSGRLADTYAADTLENPVVSNFGNYSYKNGAKVKASQAKTYVVYAEGIYTDYRYYETRYEDSVLGQGNSGSWSYDDEVVWPYGYGLSYTTFTKEIVGEPVFDNEAHTATVSVKVTNTGAAAGKEVIELYAQAPYTDYDRQNKVEKSAIQLMDFEKTGILRPGESETVALTAHLQWLASYDYTGAKGYIMDAGDYYFSVGGSAHDALNNILEAKGASVGGNTALAYKWTQASLDTETYKKSVYTGYEVTNAFEDLDINSWIPGLVTYLSRSDWQGTFPKTVEIEATADMLASLNDTKKYENGVWNNEKARFESFEVTYKDYTTLDELNAALSNPENAMNVVSLRDSDYNDEAWEKYLNNLSVYEMSRLVAQGRLLIQPCPSVSFPAAYGSDQPIGLNMPYLYLSIDPETAERTPLPEGYTMTDGITGKPVSTGETFWADMYASEPTLAATFNKELAARQGAMWAEDGLYCGASFIWAPGANMHRSPYGGRASEYPSADQIHTNLIISELTRAAQAKGLITVTKHFAINEQEQNRIGIATFTNEQALRENYLRAFEGIMTYGGSLGLMSSYNRVGLIGASAEYDLQTTVLRKEWGSEAYIITDFGSPTPGLYDGNATVVAGVSTMLNNGAYDDPSKAYVNRTLSVESIKSDPVLLAATRNAAHRILHAFIHSNAVNGISGDSRIELITPWWKPALTSLTVVSGIVAVASGVMYIIAVNKKKEDK